MSGQGIITGIRQRGRRWVIYVDGRAKLGLSRASLERLKIRVGMLWTAELEQAAQAQRSYEGVLQAAARLVNRRMLSRMELEAKLRQRGWAAELIGRVIQRLEELGMVDDQKLGELLIEEWQKKGVVGQELLRAKLLRRGLKPELVEGLLNQATAGRDLRQEAMALGRARLARLRGLNGLVQRRRLAGFLLRRGFDPELVEEVVEKLTGPGAGRD